MLGSVTRTAAVALMAGALTVLAHAGTAQAAGHKVCKAYANNAVWQHNRNVNAGCGFVGLRWHYGWQLHYNWCRGVAPWLANQERKIRRNALRACGAL